MKKAEEYRTFSRYPLDADDLDGFTPTELESQVIGNPTFQNLRKEGLKCIEYLALGIEFHSAVPPLDESIKVPLPPSQIAKVCHDYYPKLAAMQTLLAVIRREFLKAIAPEVMTCMEGIKSRVKEDDEVGINAHLLWDLNSWLTGNDQFEGFRWERHNYLMLSKAREQEIARELADFRSAGTVNLVLVLTNALPPAPRRRVFEEMRQKCAAKMGLDLAVRGSMEYFMPDTYCLGCSDPIRHRLATDCKSINTLAFVDCGELGEIKAWVSDENLRHQLEFRQIDLPKSCFRRFKEGPIQAPNLSIFDLRLFDMATRQQLLGGVKRSARTYKVKRRKENSTGQDSTIVITSGPKLELVIVADTYYYAHHARWAEAIGYDEHATEREYRSGEGKRNWFDEGLQVTVTQ